MKKIKRLLSMVLCAVLVLSLTACGGDKDTDKNGDDKDTTENSVTAEAKASLDFGGETITMIYEYQPSNEKGIDPSRDRELDRIAELEKKYNVVIEQKKGSSDYNESIITSTLSGAPVGHIIRINGNKNFNFITAGVCADLSEAMKKTGIDMTGEQYNTVSCKYFNLNNKQYLASYYVPQESVANNLWLFNKKIFEELNLESPYDLMKENKWTWEKVTELAKLATKRSADGTITQYGLGLTYAYRALYAMSAVNGGSLGTVSSAGDPQASLNTPEVKAALEQIYNWGAVDKIAVFNDGSLENTAIDKMFYNGEIAILSGSPSSINRAYSNGMTDFGVVLAPMGPNSDGYKALVTAGDGFIIPKVYEDMADKLLLLLDDLYAPYEESYEQLLKEDWIGKFSDSEGWNNFKKASLDEDIQVVDPFTLFNLEFIDPAFATVCGNVASGKVTAGTAIDRYNDQYQAILDDNFDGFVFTGLGK